MSPSRAPAPGSPAGNPVHRFAQADFRGDVDGLRAVAICLVVLAHADVGFAGGGYVGVDVFFVISGFLITRLLVAEIDRTGSVSLLRFYGRRVKRLMPQVITVIAAVVVLSRVLLSPLGAETVARDVMAAGAYAMNWHLSAEAADYFASGGGEGPLDHLWSLGVEEQFYAVWPLLLLAVAAASRARGPASHGVLGLAVGAIVVTSLLYAVQQVHAAPKEAYFSAFGRAWELGLGAVLALALLDRRMGRRCAAVAAWAGIAAIGAATVAFGPATGFPGLPALVPTLGAVALIAAGSSTMPPGPTRALTTRPARYVGRLSYAWYLWHWPPLFFAAAVWGPLSVPQRVALVVASLLPTIVTHRWIEEPLRRSTLHLRRPRVTVAAALAGPAIAVACGLALSATISSPPALGAADARGAAQLAKTRSIQRSAAAVRPDPRHASADRGRSHDDGCLAEERATTSPRCAYGDRRSKTTVVLFGDSHAMQYFPALQRIALRRNWRLVQLTKSGCPPPDVRVIYVLSNREYRECDVWRQYALRRIERVERPALVLAASSAYYRVLDDAGRRLSRQAGTQALADGYAPVLRRLASAAPRVAVLADPPRPPWDIPDCVSDAMKDLRRCAFPKRAAVAATSLINTAVERVEGVDVIDLTSRFCLARLCPAVIGNVLVYRNSGHVTATFVETLTPWLGRRLPTRLGEPDA